MMEDRLDRMSSGRYERAVELANQNSHLKIKPQYHRDENIVYNLATHMTSNALSVCVRLPHQVMAVHGVFSDEHARAWLYSKVPAKEWSVVHQYPHQEADTFFFANAQLAMQFKLIHT